MPSRISWPVGCCIQLLAERIQNAEMAVPIATTTADSTYSQRRHAVEAEQQDAEEGRLEEERGQHLVADQRADDVADHDREAAPVGAELVAQHDAGHDAHRERHREDPGPEPHDPVIALLAGAQPKHPERRDIGRQPDREGRKNDVERDGEGELQARQQDGIEVHRVVLREAPGCDAPAPCLGNAIGTLTVPNVILAVEFRKWAGVPGMAARYAVQVLGFSGD